MTHSAENDAARAEVPMCRTCAHALTDREREDYVDQCETCVLSPGVGETP